MRGIGLGIQDKKMMKLWSLPLNCFWSNRRNRFTHTECLIQNDNNEDWVQWVHGRFWEGWEKEESSQDRVMLKLSLDDKCCLTSLKPNQQLQGSEWHIPAAAELIPPIFSCHHELCIVLYVPTTLSKCSWWKHQNHGQGGGTGRWGNCVSDRYIFIQERHEWTKLWVLSVKLNYA